MRKNIVYSIGQYKGKEVMSDRSKAANGHVMTFGSTGYGKSTENQKIMVQIAEQGATVIAFDANNIFADDQIHKAYKQKFNEYLNEIDVYYTGISMPLLTPMVFSDGKTEKDVDVIDSLTESITKPMRFGANQKSNLRTAVEAVYEQGLYKTEGIAAIAGMLEIMDTAKSLEVKERISQITEHNIFRDGELFIKPGKINILRISKFSEDTQRVIMEIVTSFIWKYAIKEKFVDDGLYLVIDECQNMDLGKNGMIAKILVEGRRFNLNLMLSTQVLPKDQHIRKLMTQASLILNFKPAKSDMKAVANLIKPGDGGAWMIRLSRLKIGEFVASGQIMYEGRLITEPFVVSARIADGILIKGDKYDGKK